MTPHHVVANDPLVAEHAALLAKATQTVADPQVRHRGTFGGALAHADPAGDLLAPTLALDAEFEIAGSGGRRTVPASEFFVDLFTTALGDDEILTSVRVPKTTGWGSHYQKFTRVGPAVVDRRCRRGGPGRERQHRRGSHRADQHGIHVRSGRASVEQALAGCALDEAAIAAATASAGEGTNPPSDTNGDADYRRHLAGVLTARAVSTAGGVAPSAPPEPPDGPDPPVRRPGLDRDDLGSVQRPRAHRSVLSRARRSRRSRATTSPARSR